MAGLIRGHDWAATPLGPIEGWPQSLRTAVDVVLGMPGPATILWGPTGIQIYNDAYVAIAWDRHPALLGRPVAEGWPDIHEVVLMPLLAAVGAGRATRLTGFRVVLDRPGGKREERVFDTDWSPLRDESGAVAGALQTLVEVTDRIRAEAATRASEGWLFAVFEALPVGVGVVNREGALVRQNEQMRRFLPTGAVPSRDPPRADRWRAWTADGSPVERRDYPAARALRGENALHVQEFLYTADDGSERWTRVVAAPLHDGRAEITGAVVVVSDIDAIKRAQEAARAGEKQQAYLLRLGDALRPLTDPAAVQEAATRLLGEHLGVTRAVYAEVIREGAGDYVIIEHEYRAPGAESFVGRHAAGQFGPDMEELCAGRAVAVSDTEAEPAAEEGRAVWRALGVRARMGVPLVKNGCLVAALGVHHAEPRAWTPEEIALVTETGERTWAAVERARAQAALHASEERFRAVAEAIEDVFYVTDLERGTLEYLSPSYERVWGRPASEILADLPRFIATLHPDDLGVFEAAKTEQIRGEPVVAEYRICRPDGEVRHILDRSYPVPGATGRRSAGIASDVTQRRRAEAALRESEERLRRFGEASSDILWIRDAGTLQWEYLSPAFEATYGLSREEALAGDTLRNWEGLVLPEDRERAVASIRRVATGEGLTFEYRVRRPADGGVRWLRDTDFPIRDAAGRVVRIGGIGQDVTELKAAEAAVAASEARLRTVLEGIPQLVWRSRDAGQWTWSSPQWQEFTGQRGAESLARGWLDAVHPEDRARTLEAWDAAPTAGLLDVNHRLRRAGDGAWRWHQTRALPVGEGEDAEWLGTCTDIEDAIRAGEVLARSREELEELVAERTGELERALTALQREIADRNQAEEALRQAQKMEAVGRLTGGIAHDFNNMLQGVTGAMAMASRRLDAGRTDDVRRYLGAANDAALRAAGLTRRLLAFARRQRLEPRQVDPDLLVSGMAEIVRRTVGPAIAVKLRLGGGAGVVRCDPNELESAVLNLCVNARDAMPRGGQLVVGTADATLSRANVAGEEGATPGDFVEISVEDTGTGMPPEVLARVTEPFFTTKPQGAGTGLGLSQVYGFAHQSGGLLRIESTPGQGTRVRILLPRRRGEATAEVETLRLSPAAHGDGVVLLVDDEPGVRGPAAERLRELGLTVVEAADGPEAIRRYGEEPCPDMLVTDVGLPGGMNGRQVAEALRERRPDLPVMFISGYSGDVLPPGVEVIGKPFQLDELARRVLAVLRR